MKNQKYILHSVAVLAVAALATACSSEEILKDKTSGSKETMTITAYQPNTRVGFDSNGDGYWQAGDEIGVWSNGDSGFSPFAITSGAGEASATFSGEVTDGIGQYAVYPFIYYPYNCHSLSDNTLTYSLPSEYTYTSVDQTILSSEKNGNSFRMPMYGTITNNDVSFKHLGGVICLKIDKMPAESGTVTVTESTNQLCGTVNVSLADATPEITTKASTSNNSVTFNYSNATEGNPGVFYLPVATGTYNLTVKVEGGDKESTTTLDAVEITRTQLHAVKVVTDYGTETEEADCYWGYTPWFDKDILKNGKEVLTETLSSGNLPTNKITASMTDNGGGTKSFTINGSDYRSYYDMDSSKYPLPCSVWWFAIPTTLTIVSGLENGDSSWGYEGVMVYRLTNNDVLNDGNKDTPFTLNINGIDYYVFAHGGITAVIQKENTSHTLKITIK